MVCGGYLALVVDLLMDVFWFWVTGGQAHWFLRQEPEPLWVSALGCYLTCLWLFGVILGLYFVYLRLVCVKIRNMKKVLLVGNSPLPGAATISRPAAGLRTYQFKEALERAGFEVFLVCIAMPECYEVEPETEVSEAGMVISKNDLRLVERIREAAVEFGPEAIVGVNTFPSYVASRLGLKVPFWADLNGWIMAEGQAQAYKSESNAFLGHYFEMERAVLERADKISCVSRAQGHAILGELAFLGRLNKESFGYNFVEWVPNGTEDFDKGAAEIVLPEGFLLLWMGGYNTWVDEITLFKGIEKAMERCSELKFVSTGGAIKGLDKGTFKNFYDLVEASPFKERFVFLGWVDSETIPYIYRRAQAGINVDRMCVETLTGARNRINEMMKFGLPVITTLGSEISYEVARVEAGLSVSSGDFEGLAEAIEKVYSEWKEQDLKFVEYGRNGRRYIEEFCNYEVTVAPLVSWLGGPSFAQGERVDFARAKFSAAVKYLKDRGLKQFLRKLWQKIR